MNSNEFNRLVIIGNGFDLAHGLKTSYRDFLDWYMVEAFHEFYSKRNYADRLIEIKNKYANITTVYKNNPTNFEEVLKFIEFNDRQSITYNSEFFHKIINLHGKRKWVDIEVFYFQLLKGIFLDIRPSDKDEAIETLNKDFNFLIIKLTQYINVINDSLSEARELPIQTSRSYLKDVISFSDGPSSIRFLNFNYTETLSVNYSIDDNEIIHIHGRAKDLLNSPIIFGYGDESDPDYQKIEDSGKNIYLEHIKSFGYFQTNNYNELLSFIDSKTFNVYIVGHSCGLSDRVLLNQIFAHQNCSNIEIFYHQCDDGTDNFKEITQEISRHFKPQDKSMMRRRVRNKNNKNFIPQSSNKENSP